MSGPEISQTPTTSSGRGTQGTWCGAAPKSHPASSATRFPPPRRPGTRRRRAGLVTARCLTRVAADPHQVGRRLHDVDVRDDDRESVRRLGHLGLHRQVTAAFFCRPKVDDDGPDSRWSRVLEDHLRRIPSLFGQRHEGGAVWLTSSWRRPYSRIQRPRSQASQRSMPSRLRPS